MKFVYKPRGGWYGPYALARTLNPWKNQDKAEDFIDRWGECFARIKPLVRLFEWIDSKRKDTVKVRLDKWDHFDAYMVIAAMVAPLLKAMQEDHRGSPMVDANDVPSYVTKGMDEQDAIHVRWGYVLEEIIWAMEQVRPNFNWEEQYYDNDELYVKRDKHEARMAEGFRLFGKYFMNLWV